MKTLLNRREGVLCGTFLIYGLVAQLLLAGGVSGQQLPRPELKIQSEIRWEAVEGAALQQAAALDLDSEGSLYIVDRGKNRLLKFTAEGAFLREVGGFGREADQFDDPRDVDAHNTLNVFVADFNNNRVVRFDRNLNFIGEIRGDQLGQEGFEQVLSVAVSAQYDIFLLENLFKQVIKLDREFRVVARFGGIDEAFGQLIEPYQMALEENRRLFVSDPAQQAVVVFDYLGNYLSTYRWPQVEEPAGLYWAADGQLYVVDAARSRLVVFERSLRPRWEIFLPDALKDVFDVAVFYDRATEERRVVLLAPQRCWIARLVFKTQSGN